MADGAGPCRAGLAKGLRYIFVGFISLGFAVGPMLPVWLADPAAPDDPPDADPDRPRPPDSAPERGLAPRPFSDRSGDALSGAEEAVWEQLVHHLRPTADGDWEVPE